MSKKKGGKGYKNPFDLYAVEAGIPGGQAPTIPGSKVKKPKGYK